MCKDTEKNNNKYELLPEQRKQSVTDFPETTKSSGCFSAVITLSSGILSVFLPDIITFSNLSSFAITQLFLTFLLSMPAQMNTAGDYVRAIDEYVKEHYRVTKLFCQGEISYKHTSG